MSEEVSGLECPSCDADMTGNSDGSSVHWTCEVCGYKEEGHLA